ncbi:NUDIX domain-containing protein [Isoptericola variabilis]|uniref:NUDIX hydrolase n=1 Tax=Isoptericola variabilis (strain 225) TaxID=743718 RepID=F6FUI3_ISOV2|nr:NUDIX domain-containing protein [Isoptericola variabilis]AEG45410.1 NUDIX hydrolase [Isoptericola variabilis 225]TWH28138.1 ADP-ribose pyrophosphatase YjhB (NUDIX family) [Isoptericola variabilis J7]
MPIPPYVAGLRERIGTDLLWLPGVTAVVLDDDGRVLLGRRADSGLWALVSGILEPGEEPAVGLAREVLEETAVEVRIEALAAVSTTPVITYPNGDRSAYLDLCFVARPVSREAAAAARVADDESLEVAWFPVDALPDDVTRSSRERLELAQRYLAAPQHGTIFVR